MLQQLNQCNTTNKIRPYPDVFSEKDPGKRNWIRPLAFYDDTEIPLQLDYSVNNSTFFILALEYPHELIVKRIYSPVIKISC